MARADSVARNRRLMSSAGAGFVVGSALFVAGVPLSLTSSLAPAVSAWTYFVGSVFFTVAATLQMFAALRPDDAAARPWRAWSGSDRANLLAAVVQWVGTIAFNVTTVRSALDASARGSYDAHLVWAPDAFGSVLFLVASAIALVPEVHRRRLASRPRPRVGDRRRQHGRVGPVRHLRGGRLDRPGDR